MGCEPIRNWYAAQKKCVIPPLSYLSYGGYGVVWGVSMDRSSDTGFYQGKLQSAQMTRNLKDIYERLWNSIRSVCLWWQNLYTRKKERWRTSTESHKFSFEKSIIPTRSDKDKVDILVFLFRYVRGILWSQNRTHLGLHLSLKRFCFVSNIGNAKKCYL